MAYKIEYSPEYVKKDLFTEWLRRASGIMLLTGIAVFAGLLWYNRTYVIYALEKLAIQLQDGEAALDAIAAFCETIQGGLGG